MKEAFEENNLLDTIEYIEPSAGGFWASTHLHFKTDEQLNYFVRAAGCNENDWSCLGRKYTQGVNEIIAVYFMNSNTLSFFINSATFTVGI